MTQIEIVVGRRWPADAALDPGGIDLVHVLDVIDIVVEGDNLTSHISRDRVFFVIADLAESLLALMGPGGEQRKHILRFYESPWELVLVRADGGAVLLSLYRAGRDPAVVAHNRPVAMSSLVAATRLVIDDLVAEALAVNPALATSTVVRRLREAVDAMRQQSSSMTTQVACATTRDSSPRQWAESTVTIGALEVSYHIDVGDPYLLSYDGNPELDLHAMLCDGQLVAGDVVITPDYPVLALRRLFEETREALRELENASLGTTWRRRIDEPSLRLVPTANGVRLELIGQEGVASAEGSLDELLMGIAQLGRSVLAELTRGNPTIATNARYSDLERVIRKLEIRSRAVATVSSTAPLPTGVVGRPVPGTTRLAMPFSLDRVRRFLPRQVWRHDLPGLEQQSLSVAGEMLLVGWREGISAVRRIDGSFGWTRAIEGASVTLAPGAAAILSNDGDVELVGLVTGERRWKRRLGLTGPLTCAQGGAGRIVLATHAEVVGVETSGGTAVWRRSVLPEKATTVSVCGGLTLVADGGGQLTALRTQDGRQVWSRAVGNGPVDAMLAGRMLATVSMGEGGARVSSIELESGEVRWQHDVEAFAAGRPVLTDRFVAVLTADVASADLTIWQADGQLVGRTSLGPAPFHHALTTPVWDGRRGQFIARHGDQCVAVATREASQTWSTTIAATDAHHDMPPITLMDGVIVAPGAELQFIDASTGEILVSMEQVCQPAWFHLGRDMYIATVELDDDDSASHLIGYRPSGFLAVLK